MIYLDLAEIDEVFRGRWFWGTQRSALVRFRRERLSGRSRRAARSTPCANASHVKPGRARAGPIRLLTHLAHFGYCFNPVSFYYCFDRGGERVESIVAEITNTPWGERHAYVLHAARATMRTRAIHRQFAKEFHVSPFMPMDLQYDWRFSTPDRSLARSHGRARSANAKCSTRRSCSGAARSPGATLGARAGAISVR